MQHINTTRQADRVHGTISIASVVFYDLQNAHTAESPQWLGIGVLSAALCDVERVSDSVLYVFWKEARSDLLLPIQTTGLMVGDVAISILCLNEHKKQELFFYETVQNFRKACVDAGSVVRILQRIWS